MNKEKFFNQLKYEEYEKIAEGGEGIVYKAKQEGKFYAIKVLKDKSSDRQKRYVQEIDNVNNFDCPNIIKSEYGEIEVDGIIINYVIMPYYEKNLRDIVDYETNWINLLNYINQLANAILYIHKKGVYHRDLKPENILVDNGNLVLTDFGIAHFKESKLTKKGEWLANKSYSSPEQKIKGKAHEVTSATDIYSFGSIINECFTKQNPNGINHLKISGIYPFLFELDNLTNKMRDQNASKRPSALIVLAMLKKIKADIEDNIDEIKYKLCHDKYKPDYKLNEEKIYQASMDIYAITSNDKTLYKNNINYHMDISYNLDSEAKKYIIKKIFKNKCLKKFFYETKYEGGPSLEFIETNSKDKDLCEKLEKVLTEYKSNLESKLRDNLDGEIKKLFVNLRDYHCRELLNEIGNISSDVYQSTEDKPILYIVKYLKDYVGIEYENIRYILRECININFDIERNKIDSSDNISYDLNDNIINEILKNSFNLKNKYGFEIYTEYNGKNLKATIAFDDKKKYEMLKKDLYQTDISDNKKADIEDLFKNKIEYDSIIVIEIDEYDFKNTFKTIIEKLMINN